MRYLELYNEYTSLLKRQSEARRQLQSIPRGNITVKRISGKEYHYLQYTHLGKKKCQYLRETEVDSIREALTLRETLCQEIEETSFALDRLERAVKILDETMSRMFWFLRQCADMDALPISKRSKALSFARAMGENTPGRSCFLGGSCNRSRLFKLGRTKGEFAPRERRKKPFAFG